MRGMGSWGGTAALVVGLGAAIAAAAEPSINARAAPRGLLSDFFHEKPRGRPVPKTKMEQPVPAEDKPGTAAVDEAERQRQWNAVLRRMEVCDRLRAIALQTDNEALMRQADELEARARDIYNRQTARLSPPARVMDFSATGDDKKPASRRDGADEKALDKGTSRGRDKP